MFSELSNDNSKPLLKIGALVYFHARDKKEIGIISSYDIEKEHYYVDVCGQNFIYDKELLEEGIVDGDITYRPPDPAA